VIIIARLVADLKIKRREIADLRGENERLKEELANEVECSNLFEHDVNKERDFFRTEIERLKNMHIMDCCEDYKKRQQDQIDDLKAEVKRLRANALFWHKWPEEKPKNDDSVERIKQSEWGTMYLTKTPPSRWCKSDSFWWAEIPRP
jgi:hypothetical protein